MAPESISILHFNDVYHMSEQTFPGPDEELIKIDVSHFAKSLDTLKSQIEGNSGERPLVLFSGDLFSPSAESMLAQGKNMVAVMDQLNPDACLTGNHEFDYGIQTFNELIARSQSKWILSNVIDTNTGAVPTGLHEGIIFTRGGIRIGVIGVVEEDWVGTIKHWPANFKHQPMDQTCKRLSRKLRHPRLQGGPCDIIIALTHSVLKNDIELAKSSLAYPATPGRSADMGKTHGVDLVLGGHDHDYYVGKGAIMDGDANMARVSSGEWPDYKLEHTIEDDGLLIVKSGFDFRDLSEVVLELETAPDDSVRRKLIKTLKVIRHPTLPGPGSLEEMTTVLTNCRQEFDKTLNVPFCRIEGELNITEAVVRKKESAVGNWIADMLIHAFDDTPIMRNRGKGPDGAIISGGSIRGNTVLYQDTLTARDIMEIFPYETTTVVALELSGDDIYAALEAGLRDPGSGQGCFPVVSGLWVKWDSTKPVGRRVKEIWTGGATTKKLIKRGSVGPYLIVTNSYLAGGKDGYTSFKDKPNRFPDGTSMYNTLYTHLLFGAVSAKVEPFAAYLNELAEDMQKLLPFAALLGAPGTKPNISNEQLMEAKRVLEEIGELNNERVEPEDDGELPLVTVPEVDGRLWDISRRG